MHLIRDKQIHTIVAHSNIIENVRLQPVSKYTRLMKELIVWGGTRLPEETEQMINGMAMPQIKINGEFFIKILLRLSMSGEQTLISFEN